VIEFGGFFEVIRGYLPIKPPTAAIVLYFGDMQIITSVLGCFHSIPTYMSIKGCFAAMHGNE